MDATTQARITAVFRRVNRAMVLFWRLGLGRWLNIWPRGFGRIMVISHRGFASAAAGVPVRRLTDDQLAAATSDYVLLRIAAEPDPAPIAPAADLAWVWRPVTAGALVAAVAWRLLPRRCVRRTTG